MAAPATTACATHPKRDRVASCGSCGQAICRECVVHTGVGIKCRTCTGEKAPSGRGGRERPRWLVPAAIGGAVVLVGAVLTLRGGGGSGSTDDEVRSVDAAGSQFPIERKIELTGGGNTRIGATLTLPAADKPPVAAVLIIPGFGAIDRDAVMAIANTPDRSADRLSQDQNYSRPGSPDNLFKDFSSALVALGVATLRYDKRGSGGSPLKDDQPLSYDDLVADARAGVDFLGQRRETAAVPLALVGADQGGLIAMRLAATAPQVKSVALISTFGRALADVIGGDLTRRGERGQREAEQLQAVAAQLVAGQPLPPPDQLLGNLQAVLRPLHERYLRAVFTLDPVAEARAVKVPALVVRGGADTTTTAVDTERLLRALPTGSEEQVFPDGDHNLGQNARRDANLVAQVARWLVARATA
ncbi:MAG: alpha/beta hydrolase [Acidimicrobiales bacterium]